MPLEDRNPVDAAHRISIDCLSASVAKTYFGNADPINKVMRLEDKSDVKVTGVYEDIPANSSFGDLGFIAPWQLSVKNRDLENVLGKNPWGASWFQVFVQIADNADMNEVSKKIKEATNGTTDLIRTHEKEIAVITAN